MMENFTIISNDCVAGRIYESMKLPYLTPTIGLFFYSEDYIKFLKNLEDALHCSLQFIKHSRHWGDTKWPCATILGDVEIHFLHYETEEEAAEKWYRRRQRVNYDNLYFVFMEKNNFKPEHLDSYNALPYKRKVFIPSDYEIQYIKTQIFL